MKKLFLSLLLLPALGMAQTQVGFVYEDANGNGKKDRKEKGIAGVAVTNGVDVVQTDATGKYELPKGEDNIFFVIKPADYKIQTDSNNLAKFFRIHKPKGSPDFQYKGSAPTGELPASLDFALTPQKEDRNFKALIFGDPQPYTQQEIDWFHQAVVKEVTGVKGIAFGLSLGDLVGDDLLLHHPYIKAIKEVGVPWYNLMGNHDMNYDAKEDHLSDETYEANFGPANYAFNYGNAHFIVLDDILYPNPRGGSGYWGGFRKDQLDFVENNLKFVPKDKLIVLAFHIPIFEEGGDSFRDEDRQRLFDILKDYPNVFNMSAHTHLQRQNFFGKEEGWLGAKPWHEYNAGTTSGDWYSGELDANGVPFSTMRDGTPRGYAFLNINDNSYSIDYKVTGKDLSYQMEIYAPKVIPEGKRTSANMFVNFFMGHKDSKVEYRIDNTEWRTMAFVSDVDPSYLNLLHRWDHTEKLMPGRRPSNGVKSTHLWRAGFPANLKEGVHTIEIRAKDLFGKEHFGKKSFRVEK